MGTGEKRVEVAAVVAAAAAHAAPAVTATSAEISSSPRPDCRVHGFAKHPPTPAPTAWVCAPGWHRFWAGGGGERRARREQPTRAGDFPLPLYRRPPPLSPHA